MEGRKELHLALMQDETQFINNLSVYTIFLMHLMSVESVAYAVFCYEVNPALTPTPGVYQARRNDLGSGEAVCMFH